MTSQNLNGRIAHSIYPLKKLLIMKLTEALDTFIQYITDQKRAPSTITAYSKDIEQLNNYLDIEEKVTSIVGISTEQLNNYIKKLKSDKNNSYTLKTISRKINSMKTYFKFLHSESVINSDPATSVKHPKYTISPPRILTKLEYRALRDVARYNTRLFTIVELLLQTGIRIGELTRLTIDDLNLDGNKKSLTIRVYASNPQREVVLNEPAEFALKAYLKQRPEPKEGVNSVFVTKNGNPLLVRNVRTSISRAFEKTGTQDATVNDIRNSFIVHQLKSGMPVEVVGAIVGHKRLTSTKKYLKLVDTNPKRKTTKINPL